MSISNRHPLSLFVSGESKPLTGQRLAKITYKKTDKNPAKHPSACASIPQIDPASILENVNALLPHVATLLEGAQDEIIRSLYEQADGTLIAIADSDITVEACISYLNAAAAGDRLSKEVIGQWFDAHCFDSAYALVSLKLRYGDSLTPEQDETVRKHVAMYREVFLLLAGKNPSLTDNQIGGMELALTNADDNAMTRKVAARIASLKVPKPKQIAELIF